MKKVDLTKGNVAKVLLMLALPIMGSSLLQFTYNLVDMLWIGHLGSKSLASIGSASFFINLGSAIGALIVTGAGIKVAHGMGRKDIEDVKTYIYLGIVLTGLISAIYAGALILFGKSFITFLGLSEVDVKEMAYAYLAWSAPMLILSNFNNLFSRIFVSLGSSKSVLKINTVGLILNIVLDPIFIYVFKWGVVGAAIASIVAHLMMLMSYLIMGKAYISFKARSHATYEKVSEIIHLGTPVAVQRILFTMINIFLAKIIAPFGAEAVAAQKIGVQIEAITYMVTGGLNGAVASFIGQNYGAQKQERMRKGYQIALMVGMVYSVVTLMIFLIFPGQLVGLFVEDWATTEIAIAYLKVIAYSQIFNAMEMISTGYFIGIGKPKVPSMISMIFTSIRLPMAYVFTEHLGVDGIWWSITISTILKGSVLTTIYLLRSKDLEHHVDENSYK
ncbi:MATE family efflux transporter [Cellulosilyticum ruminicola]|uniref:MATE family efflux transporter n=1 Tax=Cellulosilyticum ruminicola TaxID=425254 RepID=UPI0006CF51AB|nr:MATE family efflux transporter [Cellulosilyticum ruminicola]